MSYSTDDVAKATRLTYRRVDHYVRCGYIPGMTEPGSGHQRRFTQGQVVTVAVIAELVRHGFSPKRAAHMASQQTPEFESGHTQTRVDVAALTRETLEVLNAQ